MDVKSILPMSILHMRDQEWKMTEVYLRLPNEGFRVRTRGSGSFGESKCVSASA